MSEPIGESLEKFNKENGEVTEITTHNISHPELCPCCRTKMFSIRRIGTQNEIFVCENKECTRRLDVSKISGWKRSDEDRDDLKPPILERASPRF